VKISRKHFNPVKVGVIAFYVLFASYIWRSLTFSYQENRMSFLVYASIELLFLLLFALVMLQKKLPVWLIHAYFIIQSTITFFLILIPPTLDYLTGFYVLLSYQGALILTGRNRWLWTGIFCLLIQSSLFISLGMIKGLALGLIPIVGCIIFPVYVIANREEERDSRQSEVLLQQLQSRNKQLQEYTLQAEQIAAIEERNRLARELHDSVSQTMFSILLNTRSAQILAEHQPDRVEYQIEELQSLSQEALSEMRSFITRMKQSRAEMPAKSTNSTEVLGQKS
jgi:signal transduction histidine kinase